VYVRRGSALPPLASKYEGPYKVIRKCEKYFVIEMGDKEDSVSVDRLKPYTALGEVSPAVPPRRGRPPNVAAPAAQQQLGGVVWHPCLEGKSARD
jgi:hypothetical protein